MERNKRTLKSIVLLWLIISLIALIILAVIGTWGYFLEKKFPMNEPKAVSAAGEFIEAKWMNGMTLAEIYHQWKLEGKYWFALQPAKPGTSGLIVEKFKTDKNEDAFLYYLCRIPGKEGDDTGKEENIQYGVETIAVEIFSPPSKPKYAIYYDGERGWEGVEFFEVGLETTPSGSPWLFISFRYKTIDKKNILIPVQKKGRKAD